MELHCTWTASMYMILWCLSLVSNELITSPHPPRQGCMIWFSYLDHCKWCNFNYLIIWSLGACLSEKKRNECVLSLQLLIDRRCFYTSKATRCNFMAASTCTVNSHSRITLIAENDMSLKHWRREEKKL